MSQTKKTALVCWQRWDPAALIDVCDAADPEQPLTAPELAGWRGLAAFMAEDGQAMAWLDRAYRGYLDAGQADRAFVTAHTALVIGLLDIGAIDGLGEWEARAAEHQPVEATDMLSQLWLTLGSVARVPLGQPDTPAASKAAAHLLQALVPPLLPLPEALSPHERLLAASVLIEYYFQVQRFEQFDRLASLVEPPLLFDAAAPLLRARWLCNHGTAHYQVGNPERAEAVLQRALAMSRELGLGSVNLQTTVMLSRLLLDRSRVAEAETMIEAIDPRWGAGRTGQLIQLQQMRARVQLLRGQPARALVTLEDTQRLAEAAGLPPFEHGSRQTDHVQVYIALERTDDALSLLARLCTEHSGRSVLVNECLRHLLLAWMQRASDPASSLRHLEEGLALAQSPRYPMFFRLLPALAASICALALRAQVAPQFIDEVIRSRNLPAPADADARWPWPLWLNLMGSFELRRDGRIEPGGAKTQQKPLELLRLLACERTLALGLDAAIEALWPDADDAAARKSFEMAALRLRRLLGDATLLWVSDGRVGLDAARASSDVQQRRRLIERLEALAMKPAGHDGDTAVQDECLLLVEQVIAFTRGELLPGLPAVPWLEAQRRQTRNDTVRAAMAAAHVLGRHDAGPKERELLETALRIEPLAESLVLRLMQAHAREGRRGDALRIFERYRQQLVDRGASVGPHIEAQWRALLSTGTGSPR